MSKLGTSAKRASAPGVRPSDEVNKLDCRAGEIQQVRSMGTKLGWRRVLNRPEDQKLGPLRHWQLCVSHPCDGGKASRQRSGWHRFAVSTIGWNRWLSSKYIVVPAVRSGHPDCDRTRRQHCGTPKTPAGINVADGLAMGHLKMS